MKPWLLAKIVGLSITLVFFVLLIIPFFIQIDRFRPHVVSEIERLTNGKCRIAEMTLSLMGQVNLGIREFVFTNASEDLSLTVPKVSLQVSFWSIITGRPSVTLQLDQPHVSIEQVARARRDGVPVGESRVEPAPVAKNKNSIDQNWIDLARGSSIDLSLNQASISYSDVSLDLKHQIKNLDIKLRNVSLQNSMSLDLTSQIDLALGTTFSVSGPLALSGTVMPSFQNLDFESAILDLYLDLDQVALNLGNNYQKEPGKALNARMKSYLSPHRLEVQEMEFRVLDATVEMSLIADKLTVSPEQVRLECTANHSGLDFRAEAVLENLQIPQVSVKLDAKVIDFDALFPARAQVLPSSPDLEKSVADLNASSSAIEKSVGELHAEPADVDAMFATLREHPLLSKLQLQADLVVKSIKGFKISASDVALSVNFGDLVAEVSKFSMNVFGGKVDTSGRVDVRANPPAYRFENNVTEIQTSAAMRVFAEAFQKTADGKLSFNVKGKGKSFNSVPMKENLVASGRFSLRDAELRSIDVAKMTEDGLNSSLSKIANKYPFLSNTTLPRMSEHVGRYEQISATFTVGGGILRSPDFLARSEQGRGLDLEGQTEIDFVQDKLNAQWFVIDAGSRTGLDKVTLKGEVLNVDQIFVSGRGPARFPVGVGCSLSAPCYDYSEMVPYLGDIATQNAKAAAPAQLKGRIDLEKAKLIKRLEKDGAPNKLDKNVKSALKNLGL